MSETGVKIRYGDVAPEAKENFVPFVADKAVFVDLAQLQQYNLQFSNLGNPCEYGAVLLDNTALPFPDSPETENMGLWSNSISGADGTFETPIVLTLESNGQYSSQGFTFTFDTYNTIFCNHLKIQWYRNGEQIESAEFQPDSAFYFCRKQVQNYDKLNITFYSMNMPYNRLKLRTIDYGYGTFFYGDELKNVKVIQDIDPISTEISVNTVDFTLQSKSDMEYSFQSKQPLDVYFNGNLIATTFVTASKRKAKNQWDVNSEDYIGMLEKITFLGGMYTNQNVTDLLTNIFQQANVSVQIHSDFQNVVISGYIPICTCREALRQICFAIGAVADTSYSNSVKIYALSSEISQIATLDRIMQGQNFDNGERVTEVKLTQHTYVQTNEETEVYKAEESGTGENIFVSFSEPLHSLYIEHGTIQSSGANYAVIHAEAQCVLHGKRYEDHTVVKAIRNPTVLASDLENVAEITAATLISQLNADSILQKCYAHLVKTDKVNLKIAERKKRISYGNGLYGQTIYGQSIYDAPVRVGEIITAETEYLGNVTGRIISQRYSLNGGMLVKECEVV